MIWDDILFNNMLLVVCLRMVSFRVKVWVTYIVFLPNEIFRFRAEGDSGDWATTPYASDSKKILYFTVL